MNLEPISGRVPHFELLFYLTMEAFGKVHPLHRNYIQWDQMSSTERDLQRKDMAQLYLDTAIEFHHSGIILHNNPNNVDENCRMIDLIRDMELSIGKSYYISISPGDPTFGLPNGSSMESFCYRLADDPDGLKDETKRKIDTLLDTAARIIERSDIDGINMNADYCTNTGPFFSPDQFAEYVAPYLTEFISGLHSLGYLCIKHTDGNIMPILDQLAAAKPDALHSLDPQGGVDIAEVKRLVGDRICLIGNVNCGLIDTGTDDEYLESARYALEQGMPGYGYIFSTSNCVYTGMSLERYRAILDLWKEIGNYD